MPWEQLQLLLCHIPTSSTVHCFICDAYPLHPRKDKLNKIELLQDLLNTGTHSYCVFSYRIQCSCTKTSLGCFFSRYFRTESLWTGSGGLSFCCSGYYLLFVECNGPTAVMWAAGFPLRPCSPLWSTSAPEGRQQQAFECSERYFLGRHENVYRSLF